MNRALKCVVKVAVLSMLAVFALGLKCFLLLITFVGGLFGWQIVWPPVAVAEVEAEAARQLRSRSQLQR